MAASGAISLLLAVAGLLYPTLSLIFDANQNLDVNRREMTELQQQVAELKRELSSKADANPAQQGLHPPATPDQNAALGAK